MPKKEPPSIPPEDPRLKLGASSVLVTITGSDNAPMSVISANTNWHIHVQYQGNVGMIRGSWRLEFGLQSLDSDLFLPLENAILSVPGLPSLGPVSYTGGAIVAGGMVPRGIYKLTTLIEYTDEMGNQIPGMVSFDESVIIQITS